MRIEIVERADAGPSSSSSEHLLLREIAHRINNEIASIIGRVSLISARSNSADVKSALAGAIRILHQSADLHHALEMPAHSTIVDAAKYIRALCQSIKRAKLDDKGIELVLVEHPLQMRSEKCWRLGMIVSELITNSVRHAFNGNGGAIHVELSAYGPYAQCCVMDNGSSRGSGPAGQGLKIIAALAKDLDGEIVHRFGAEGALSILIFPLDGTARQTSRDQRIKDEQWNVRRSAAHPS